MKVVRQAQLWMATALIVLSALPLHSAQAVQSTGVRVSSCLRHVCLSLSIPQRSYPTGALVPATVTVRNGSSTQIAPSPIQLTNEPVVEVLGRRGRVLYPPPFAFSIGNLPGPFTGPGVPVPQLPRTTVVSHTFIVLRGPTVRGIFHFQILRGSRYHLFTLTTPSIRVATFRERAPSVVLERSPSVEARVISSHPRLRQQPLYHVGWFACRGPNGTVYGGSGFSEGFTPLMPYFVGYVYLWVPTRSNVLQPGCPHPIEWHVVAGWVGHTVVRIDVGGGSR